MWKSDKTDTITFSRKFTNTKSTQTLKMEGQAIHSTKKNIKYLKSLVISKAKIQKTISKFHNCLRVLYHLLNKNSKLNQDNKKYYTHPSLGPSSLTPPLYSPRYQEHNRQSYNDYKTNT